MKINYWIIITRDLFKIIQKKNLINYEKLQKNRIDAGGRLLEPSIILVFSRTSNFQKTQDSGVLPVELPRHNDFFY
ncbi:MAG: hypothetical protein ACTSPQ_13450 [Candidatus Helarchaeota archaeon]